MSLKMMGMATGNHYSVAKAPEPKKGNMQVIVAKPEQSGITEQWGKRRLESLPERVRMDPTTMPPPLSRSRVRATVLSDRISQHD